MTTVQSRTLEPFCGNTFMRQLEPFVFTRNYAFTKANQINPKRFEVANIISNQIAKSCQSEFELYDLFLNSSNSALNFFIHDDEYSSYREKKRQSGLYFVYLPLFATTTFFYLTKKMPFGTTVNNFGLPLILSGIGLSLFSSVFKPSEPKLDKEEIYFSAYKIHNIATNSMRLS